MVVAGMEPALDVLHRALQGDSAAQSFLDRTSSIYVLDATNVSHPKTYGCWNFIHQAINEVERAESQRQDTQSISYSPHLQLLANMALRVARRSNILDKRLVTMCIRNAAKHVDQTPALIDINVEIRDIVMGRIAAMALDPSLHSSSDHNKSAFGDFSVMETFCAVLAANAVSNGPISVNHLVKEWIVPSAQSLPPFFLSSVIFHIALEASRKTAPRYTLDTLQQLSATVMATVLAPVLVDAIKEQRSNITVNADSSHERNNRVAALCLQAMNQWCRLTDLSLPQIKHVCNKVQVNVVDLLSDAMYSDSGLVIDSLAELLETIVEQQAQGKGISQERMTQVRYIMQVDEVSFRTNIGPEKLVLIEDKEMSSILTEMVSAIGLQRFRFVDRQQEGDDDVCRNLARIGASVCIGCTKLSTTTNSDESVGRWIPSPGLFDLLMKSASHPSVLVCSIAVDALSQIISETSSSASETTKTNDRGDKVSGLSSAKRLAKQILPILQRRAIQPHSVVPGIDKKVEFLPNPQEFEKFRQVSLKNALLNCWYCQPEHYLASCTAAIEEFCSPTGSAQVSFHLEAALFCMASVAEESMAWGSSNSALSSCLERCTTALGRKPQSLMCNPLTLAQVCRFVRKYEKWYAASPRATLNKVAGGSDGGSLDVASDLALSTFNLCATNFHNEGLAMNLRQEGDISPFTEAAKALQGLLSHSPRYFVSNQAIAALGAGWEASYEAANRVGVLTVDDRKSLCIGICYVLSSLPESQRRKSLLALAMPALDCLERMIQYATTSTSEEEQTLVLGRISSEIIIITTMARAFTDALLNYSFMKSGFRTSDGNAAIVEPALNIIERAWPCIAVVASSFHYNECISEAMSYFLTECLPPECTDDTTQRLLNELCKIAISIIQSSHTTEKPLGIEPVFALLQSLVMVYGDVIDEDALATIEGRVPPSGREIGRSLENLLLITVSAISTMLGTTWTSTQHQGQGQPAFESKAAPADSRKQISSRALLAMFSLLRVCTEKCPVFLLHLPAAAGLDRNEDLLLRPAVESAVASLLETDVDTCRGAMEFLEATLILSQSSSNDIRRIVDEILSRMWQNIISGLVVGSCGKLRAVNLDDAASLLRRILLVSSSTESTSASTSYEETQSNLLQALASEHFLLGNNGRNACLHFLTKSSRSDVTKEVLSKFLHDLWELHQTENAEAVAESDAVAKFCRKYGS